MSSPPPTSFTTTIFPQISHRNICPSFETLTMKISSFFSSDKYWEPESCLIFTGTPRIHICCTALKRKMVSYWLLFPRFGGFRASSGVLISGRICVIGKHWYSSQAQAGHFLRSCSLLSSTSSFPQSMHTYFPAPTFCPAVYVFCSVNYFTKTFMHVKDIYELRSCTIK